VRSVYIVPVCRLARAAKQNILGAEQIFSVGMMRLTLFQACRNAGCLECVDWMPCRCRRMWPLSVAVDL
jgi:hypothetical protein